ncbi:MAG: hypothetical protein HY727_20755 [Candidatus Rokubacteria bacterium]|nr:hypothetical protein [Candidatus Rokubacteria bacterium]
MQMDIWYDLVIRELVDGNDAAAKLREDAETVQAPEPDPEEEEPASR